MHSDDCRLASGAVPALVNPTTTHCLFCMPVKKTSAEEKNVPVFQGLDASSGVALYVQLADIFRYNVMSGQWKRGHRLDNFETLALQYKVSRITVRQAVAKLVHEGILSTQRAKGTVVLDGGARLAQRAESGSPFSSAKDLKIKIVAKTVVHELPSEFKQNYEAFDSYVELNKIHVVKDVPYVVNRIFVAEEIFDRFPANAEKSTKLLRLVLAYGRDSAEQLRQHTTVEPAGIVLSGHLKYPAGSPVARILRQVYGGDRRLAYAGMSWYRGDCFEMDMTIPREMIAESPLGLTTPNLRTV